MQRAPASAWTQRQSVAGWRRHRLRACNTESRKNVCLHGSYKCLSRDGCEPAMNPARRHAIIPPGGGRAVSPFVAVSWHGTLDAFIRPSQSRVRRNVREKVQSNLAVNKPAYIRNPPSRWQGKDRLFSLTIVIHATRKFWRLNNDGPA